MISSIRNAALTLAAASLVASPVAANVGDSMDRFMDDMGAAANVTGDRDEIVQTAKAIVKLTDGAVGMGDLYT